MLIQIIPWFVLWLDVVDRATYLLVYLDSLNEDRRKDLHVVCGPPIHDAVPRRRVTPLMVVHLLVSDVF